MIFANPDLKPAHRADTFITKQLDKVFPKVKQFNSAKKIKIQTSSLFYPLFHWLCTLADNCLLFDKFSSKKNVINMDSNSSILLYGTGNVADTQIF